MAENKVQAIESLAAKLFEGLELALAEKPETEGEDELVPFAMATETFGDGTSVVLLTGPSAETMFIAQEIANAIAINAEAAALVTEDKETGERTERRLSVAREAPQEERVQEEDGA